MDGVRSLDGRDLIWEPQPRQLIALRCPADEVMYGGAKGGGKDLSIASRVPTPWGWTTMGALRVGDYVLGADGLPTRVLAVSDVMKNPSYRVCLSDGSSVIAGEGHLWLTRTAKDRATMLRRDPDWQARRRATRPARGNGSKPWLSALNASRDYSYLPAPVPTLKTTAELAATVKTKIGVVVSNHSIDNHLPLTGRSDALTVPPYTLGAWLGDGSSAGGQIAGLDDGVFEQVAADGFTVTRGASRYSRGVLKLKVLLRAAAVLNDKHIPDCYLRGSFDQRLALLQGLMDTDGWCERDGSCKIGLTRKILFDGVVELIRTLGITVNVTAGTKRATNGLPGNESKCWTACFVTSLPAFRLGRKLARQNRAPHARYGRRFVVSVEQVGVKETVCIQVENGDGMFLVGDGFIPTHNSDYLLAAPFEQIALADAKWRATGRKQRGRAILFRKNLKNLDDIITRSHELFPALDPDMMKARDCGWFKPEKRWLFRSGYKFDFAHLDGPEDHRAYHGQEITALLIDQVEEITKDVYDFLGMNVRCKDDDMRKLLMVRVTSNPGGRYAQWVRDYFVAPHRAGNKIIEEVQKLSRGRTKVTTRAFIPAKLSDNKYLDDDPDYEARIRKLPQHTQEMYLNGNWDVIIGSYFAHCWSEAKHVIDPFSIPASWPLKFGMDWGTVAPACLLVGARDNDGNVYIIDEIYGPGATGRKFAERIKMLFTKQRWSDDRKWSVDDVYGLLDYEAWAKRGEEGPTAAVSMQQAGIRLFKANKNRHAGNEQVLERLAPSGSAKPALYFFRDRCPNIIRTLPALLADEKNPNDVNTDGEDHAYDALKYLLLDWPLRDGPKEQQEDSDVERWLRLARGNDDERNDSITGYA